MIRGHVEEGTDTRHDSSHLAVLELQDGTDTGHQEHRDRDPDAEVVRCCVAGCEQFALADVPYHDFEDYPSQKGVCNEDSENGRGLPYLRKAVDQS